MAAIFLDGFLHRLYPPHAELTLEALRHFQPEQYGALWPWALLGGWAASLLLYGLGMPLRRLPARISTEAQRARLEALRPHALRFLPWLLLLSSTPLGGVAALAAGFFALKPWQALLPVIVGDLLLRGAW